MTRTLHRAQGVPIKNVMVPWRSADEGICEKGGLVALEELVANGGGKAPFPKLWHPDMSRVSAEKAGRQPLHRIL